MLNDDEPRPVRQADEAGGAGPGGDLSRSQDLRRGQKHHMEVDDDATSPPSVAPKNKISLALTKRTTETRVETNRFKSFLSNSVSF